jgi:putative nucleotidyltransferase with HDIG domain
MERVNKLYNLPEYQEAQKIIDRHEQDRIFCRHDHQHSLDVARLMYIFRKESGVDIDVELMYAAALMHDIGRALQYIDAVPHHAAGAEMSAQWLPKCGFTEEETEAVVEAVQDHRQIYQEGPTLKTLLYAADKASRPCYSCGARFMCNWPEDRMNLELNW